MGSRAGQSDAGGKLIFTGHRWPAARACGRSVVAIVGTEGTLAPTRGIVDITTTGQGRAWTPEPVDATWRNLADLDLESAPACEGFVRRYGDPSGLLKPQIFPERTRPAVPSVTVTRVIGRSTAFTATGAMDSSATHIVPKAAEVSNRNPDAVNCSRWFTLAHVLRQAAQAWESVDTDGSQSPERRHASARSIALPQPIIDRPSSAARGRRYGRAARHRARIPGR